MDADAEAVERDGKGSERSRSSSAYTFRLVGSKQDIPAVIELARQAHEESRLGYIPFSEKKTQKIAENAIKDPTRHAVMLALKAEQPVGLISPT
ncbi:hypothetical protein [Pseudovibrio sp. WM33]|uniref:hypothetical protein n=1 Tax=Pseudovibrio sp. WM33 TaxID=1735585 RepID=UPI0007B2A67B|nr:hypothetical protein [Pseudovibrio sp. WM33]KZL24101.1 hypothetical protein PsWM33_02793 [Pseudovibrio sp. WM33]